jgi:hypothetical protein
LEQAAAAGMAVDPGGPPCPRELAYILAWFAELSAARAQGFAGPAPLSYSEIAAWSTLTGNTPTPYETRMLRALDAALMRTVNNGTPAKHGN